MNFDKNITVSFTGHRTYHNLSDEVLCNEIRRLYNQGLRIFMCGMARGFDLAAGECVLKLRDELPGVRLRCVIAFYGQERSFSKRDRERYARLEMEADEVIILEDTYHAGAYHQRNDFLVENSSIMVAYYNGTKGGTQYTLRRSLKSGLRIINLCTFRVGELFENLK